MLRYPRVMLVTIMMIVLGYCVGTSPAFAADTITVCEKFDLPGKEHTLNPHAPPAQQRQEKGAICYKVKLEKPTREHYAPIDDYRTGPRAVA